ncbi:serine hydrolase domain-containing protein [Wenzhouxiangella marina]|uniref:Uncharacterized protein n=1 Tax=Wenzhouxiangella marina TaxID=1579979 RepID=A0A0K0XXC3_9GAMM|nr:serine hydrolase domain-containing protein [Wenzhouxiangella marina]AKS42349.1 hypothetical protein WM2015_1983 [Wenzhouxiangella marina]MBB6085878.1 CubicO group peptidase (beta-lactamase class C family) [Wenzhouxiangella marina]
MLTMRLSIPLLLTSALLSSPAFPETTVGLDEPSARFAEVLQAYADVYGFSGALRVARGETVLSESAVGLADRSFTVPFTPGTRNSINSISKVFTVAAAMRLVERGALDLDLAVSHYLPDLGAPWQERVTVRQLLAHRSGLPREAGLDASDERELEAIMPTVAALPLVSEPGERYAYSNAGVALLGRVLEVASGLDLPELIEDEVLSPLDLNDTGMYRGRQLVERQARPYRMGAAGVVHAQRSKTLGESAGGGLYSTVADLHRFVRALRQPGYLQQASLDTMFAPASGELGSDYEALGWSIKYFGEERLWFAAGSGYGTKSVILYSPVTEEFIGLVSNWGNTPILDLLRDVYLSLKGQDVRLPSRDQLASVEEFRARLGLYRFDEEQLRQTLQVADGLVRLHSVDGKLFMDDELMARGEGGALRLTYTDELQIRFEDDAMWLEINGQRLRGERVERRPRIP